MNGQRNIDAFRPNLYSSTNNTEGMAKAAASTHYTGFMESKSMKGQVAKDFSRLMSATTHHNPRTINRLFVKSPTNAASALSVATKRTKTPKCGILAIDKHYKNVDNGAEVDCARESIDFKRLVNLIHAHWKAHKFPMCEQKYVTQMLTEFTRSPNFIHTQEAHID
jgi:hypothetical protein